MRESSADTQVSEGVGGRAPSAREDCPAARGAARGEAAVPWRPMEICRSAETDLQSLEEPTMERVDAQRRLETFGKPTLEQVLAGPVEEWREQLMLEQVCWQDLGDPGRSSLFLKDCTPWKGPKLKQFVKNCSSEF